MESAPGGSASSNDFLDASKDIPNSEMKSSKEIRKEFFVQLQAWINMMNTYQRETRPKIAPNTVPETPNTVLETPNTVPETPNTVPETSTVGPDQFCGIRCRIPPLWKRAVAEFIDFLILGIIKYVIAYFVFDYDVEVDMHLINQLVSRSLEEFSMEHFATYAEMTSEFMPLEVIHRLIVCVYEIWFLRGSSLYGGGASIGKMLLDLQVVRTSKIYHIRGQPASVIAVTSGGCLGWNRAAIRSVFKNLIFVLFLPLSLMTIPFKQKRCVHDFIGGSVVVEDVELFRGEQSELIPNPQ